MPVPHTIIYEFFRNDSNIYESYDEDEYEIDDNVEDTRFNEVIDDLEMYLLIESNKAIIKHIHKKLNKLDSLSNTTQQKFIDRCFAIKYGDADISEDVIESYMYDIFDSKQYKQIKHQYKLKRYTFLNNAYRYLFKLFHIRNNGLRDRYMKWFNNEFH